jgi:thiol-disulfide isomerase/thioredoxin
MKSVFVNQNNVDCSRYLILFLIIAFIHQTSSGVLPSQNSVSLYTANDKVVILTSQNFSSTVYQSKTAWLIEFYASWCGHCQSYANVRIRFFLIKNLFFIFIRLIEKLQLILGVITDYSNFFLK